MRISWKALGAIGAIVLAQGLCGGGIAHAQCTGNVFANSGFEAGVLDPWVSSSPSAVLGTPGTGGATSSCAVFEQTTSAPVLTPPAAVGALELRYKDSLTLPANIISETLTCNTTDIPTGSPMNLYLWIKQEQTGDPADKITVTINDGSVTTQSSVDTAGGDLTTPLSINVDSFAGKTVSVVIQADTKTATDKPTLYLFRAAEFAATPPAAPTASAVLFSSANYVEDPSVAVIPGYTVPVEYVDTAGGYSVFRFGGIGYPSISCKLSMLSGSGSAADQLLVVSGDPLAQVGMLAAADTASSNICDPVTASLSAMPSGKLAFRSTITGSTTFVMDDVSMTYACKALTDLFASATPPVTAEVLTDGNFEGGTSPWETAAPVATTQSIVITTPDACSATHAAVFEALKVPEITLSQTVDIPGNPDLLKFWLNPATSPDPADTFECVATSGGVTKVLTSSATGNTAGSYAEFGADVLSYKATNGVTFTFRARFGSGKPAKFSLDDVCLQPPYGINITEWRYEVTPPVIGPRQQATITVIAPGGDLTGTELRMVPQIPMNPDTVAPTTYSTTPSRYIAWPLAPVMNGTQSTATFTVTFAEPFNSSEDASALICTDGIPAFYLAVAGMNGQLLMAPTSTPQLLIDTVAPELDLVTAPPSVTTANTLMPVTEGPGGWPPLSSGIPRSNGILLNSDVNWFIREVTDPGLVLAVNAHFADRFPVDGSGNSYAVERSGFIPATAPLSTGALAAANPTVTPPDLNPKEILVNWTTPPLDYGSYSFLPDAQDGAGNTALVKIPGTFNFRKLDHFMRVFYMPPPPVAILDANSTSPNQQTSTPRFGWSVTPSTGLSPLEEAPCYPVAAFQVWAVDPATGAFVSLTSNAWIWVTGVIDTNTPVAVGVTLGDVLRANRADPAQAKELYLALRGGDVAGNVQPFDASLLTTNGVAQGLSLNGVNFIKWINGANQGNVAVDTDLNVSLSHAPGGANSTMVLRYFGGMSRVPLPLLEEAKQGAYVRATASMSARFPAAATVVLIYWKLYEDGALVAQGQASPGSTGQVAPFPVPEGLLNPANYGIALGLLPDPTAFLRIGPDGVKNRMGDEANQQGVGRKREVHYMLVAQTAATIPSLNSVGTGFDYQIITDPTPASVEFSIYVPEMENKVREEQPVRIYERN